jgi:hypothetical protein
MVALHMSGASCFGAEDAKFNKQLTELTLTEVKAAAWNLARTTLEN